LAATLLAFYDNHVKHCAKYSEKSQLKFVTEMP
jgi:hypothetical protein